MKADPLTDTGALGLGIDEALIGGGPVRAGAALGQGLVAPALDHQTDDKDQRPAGEAERRGAAAK